MYWGWVYRINSGMIYTKESRYFAFHGAYKSSYFIMLRFFGSWWIWENVFSMTKTNFPFMWRTRLRFPKQAACAAGWDGTPAHQQICWRAFLDGFLLLLDFKCCLEILIHICCHCGLNDLCSYHTTGQTIRFLVYLRAFRYSCLPNTVCDLVPGFTRDILPWKDSCFTPTQLTTAARLLVTSTSGRTRMVPKTARAQWDQSPLHW